MSPRYTAVNVQSPQNSKGGRPAHKRFSLVAATAVAAAGIGAVAATVGVNAIGSLANSVPTKPVQLSGLQLLSADVPAPQSADSVAAAVAAHAVSANWGTPVVVEQAPAPAAPSTPAPAKPAPAKPDPAKPARAKLAVAKPAPKAAPAPASPQQPYLVYDSVTPTSIPARQQVATYVNGAYAASPASVAGRGNVLWIDTNGSDPKANALDVEPGDATPAGAAAWVNAKLSADHQATAIVYTMISDWQQVKADVAGLPNWMQGHVRYWIADPTGVPHVVPGSNATQWYWGSNYDITTANPGFQG